jgi:surface carbohydrate biosynthesis protein
MTMKIKNKILSLVWPNADRDLHILMPVLTYLQKEYRLEYKVKSIFNGYYYLLKYRPKILVISGFAGACVNYDITKLAYSMGIKVVSLISEGNVVDTDWLLWNDNYSSRQLYLDKFLLWSKRTERMALSKYPYLDDKIVATGATGFDRYKLLNFKSKDSFLKENNLKYKKIIGIASYGFCYLFGDFYKKRENIYVGMYGQDQIDMYRNDLVRLQKIYREIINNNPDILFILRYHPGTIDFEKNEFYGLEDLDNVFISNNFTSTDYQVADLINISDLWIAYETTTALEAWLLGKQTFLINPTRSDFIRENVHKGSPIVSNETEAQLLIDEYYLNGSIEAFQSLESERKKIIKDVIEFDDGKNHVRAAEEIIKVLEQPDRKVKYKFKIYKEAFKQILKIILSKTIFRKRWPKLVHKRDFAKPYEEAYDKAIDV